MFYFVGLMTPIAKKLNERIKWLVSAITHHLSSLDNANKQQTSIQEYYIMILFTFRLLVLSICLNQSLKYVIVYIHIHNMYNMCSPYDQFYYFPCYIHPSVLNFLLRHQRQGFMDTIVQHCILHQCSLPFTIISVSSLPRPH